MPYFSYFVATNVYALFKKSVKQICNLNVQNEGGGGEVMFFLTMLKKSRIGWGWHPSLTWLGPNSNRILQITSPRCRGGGRVAGLVPKKHLITPSLIHSLDFFVVCTMTIVDVAHETGTTQHKLGQQYFR